MSNPFVFVHPHKVAFVETDLAGIAHFSRFPLWVEEAEAAFWQSKEMTTPVITDDGTGLFGWPRVSFSIRYLAPVRYAETISIALKPVVSPPSALTWKFRIMREGILLAEGSMGLLYAVAQTPRGSLKRLPIPPELLAMLP